MQSAARRERFSSCHFENLIKFIPLRGCSRSARSASRQYYIILVSWRPWLAEPLPRRRQRRDISAGVGSLEVVRGERIETPRCGKEVHAADVARAVELLLQVDAKRIAGQSFSCYDMYVAEEKVARIAKELTGSPSVISDLNRGPKHQIDTRKIRGLGMTFGGEELLRRTVEQLVEANRG